LVSSSCSSIWTVVDESLSFIFFPSFSSIFHYFIHPLLILLLLLIQSAQLIFLGGLSFIRIPFFHPSFADSSVHSSDQLIFFGVDYLSFIHLQPFSSIFQSFHACFADSISSGVSIFHPCSKLFIHSHYFHPSSILKSFYFGCTYPLFFPHSLDFFLFLGRKYFNEPSCWI
jgi:hypothetical protein